MSDTKRIGERDALINESLLETFERGARRTSFGTQVCQRCGRLDSWVAIGPAIWGRFRPEPGSADFVCNACADEYGGLMTPAAGKRFSRDTDRFEVQYCELCAVELEARRRFKVRGRWLCDGCLECADVAGIIALMHSFFRQRFLRQQPADGSDAAAWIVELAGHGAALDVEAVDAYLRRAILSRVSAARSAAESDSDEAVPGDGGEDGGRGAGGKSKRRVH